MNRSLLIILVPALPVGAGYVFILGMMGIAPGYPVLVAAVALFFGALYRLSRPSGKKAKAGER